MNSKNALQEYCQKNKLPIPRYETEQMPFTSPHAPMFVSTLMFRGTSYDGEPAPRKKDAEQSVAQKVMEHIGLNEETHDAIQIDHETLLVIDLENTGAKRAANLLSRIKSGWEKLQVMVFASENHYIWNSFPNLQNFKSVTKITSPPGRKDGADVYLSAEVGMITQRLTNAYHIIIWTSDHFGYALVDWLQKHDFSAICTNTPFTSNV